MKTLFVVAFSVLVAASLLNWWSLPETRSKHPVIYWVSDANPAREKQIATYEKWAATRQMKPVTIKIDSVNGTSPKVVIQGVSGVCGDIIDFCGGADMRFRQAVGMLEDITDDAKPMGFSVDKTYPAVIPDITRNGRQYSFPCNVSVTMYWINRDLFERHGVPVPPRRLSVEAFESIGKQLVNAANTPGRPRQVFMASGVDVQVIWRSMGSDLFNETGTACGLTDARAEQAMALVHRWTHEDHLLPSQADRSSFSSESGFGGSEFQLFGSGNYAMLASGRWALIQLRQFGKMNLAVSEPPHVQMPNTIISTRASAVYAGSQHKALAKQFLAYLASEDYNQLIVEDGDALPPNPAYTKTQAFIKPADYPNEWGCHEAFSDAAEQIAITAPSSRYVLDKEVDRICRNAFGAVMAGLKTPAQAREQMVDRINTAIARTLDDQPALRVSYEKACAIQQKIQAYRSQGKPVPAHWITNPFHRAYYKQQGWLEQ